MKLIGIKLMLAVACITWCGRTDAAEVLSSEELRELQVKMGQRQTLGLRFEQIRTSALRPKKPSKSRGTAVFAKPNRFRWEIQEPAADVLIFDGKNLFAFKPGEGSATRFKAEGDRAAEIRQVIDFVLDFDSLTRNYQILESSRDSKAVTLMLKPKVANSIAKLEIKIDQASNFVKNLKIQFENKNSSEFAFSDMSSPPDATGIFVVPSGMKVVEGI